MPSVAAEVFLLSPYLNYTTFSLMRQSIFKQFKRFCAVWQLSFDSVLIIHQQCIEYQELLLTQNLLTGENFYYIIDIALFDSLIRRIRVEGGGCPARPGAGAAAPLYSRQQARHAEAARAWAEAPDPTGVGGGDFNAGGAFNLFMASTF